MREERVRRSCVREEEEEEEEKRPWASSVVRSGIGIIYNSTRKLSRVQPMQKSAVSTSPDRDHRFLPFLPAPDHPIDEFPPRWNHQETIHPRRIFSDPFFLRLRILENLFLQIVLYRRDLGNPSWPKEKVTRRNFWISTDSKKYLLIKEKCFRILLSDYLVQRRGREREKKEGESSLRRIELSRSLKFDALVTITR